MRERPIAEISSVRDGDTREESSVAERSRAPRRFARRGGIERRVRYARLLRYAIPHWPTIAGAVALTLLGSAMAGLQPWPLKLLVDHGLGNAPLPEPVRALLALFGSVSGGLAALGADPDRLPGFGVDPDRLALVVLAALATIAVYALGAAIDAWLAIAWSRAGQRMVYRLAGDVFLQLQRLSLRFHSRRPVGDSLSRVTGDSWTVYTLVDGLLLSPVKHLTVLSTVGFLAWQLDPRLTLLLLAAMPALAASALWFGGRLLRAERSRREALAALTAFVHQVLGALPAVQALGAAGRNSVVFGSLARDVVVATRSGALTRDGFAIVNGVATTIGVALVVYAGGSRVLEGALSLGSLLVFVAYARSLEVASRGLMRTWGELRGADAGIERVLEILEARDRVVDPARPQALPVRRAGTSGHVVFERVTFGYEPGRPVLRDLSLEVLQGETVALVGATGAGKTTLASLVPRFFDPWSGRVLLDGIDVRCVRLSALRGELGLVLQDPFILPLTVADNIAWGRPGASRSEIEAAAHAANADEFIRALPEGYDTAIGERGAGLSGGQRQRIAIARALLKDPRVLILDEPTSALDAGSETLVVDALSRVRRHRTTLIIAHRLSTIRAADRIVVLDGGRVAESGSHDDLLRRGGAYAAFCTLSALPGETSLRVPASQGRVPTRRSGPTR